MITCVYFQIKETSFLLYAEHSNLELYKMCLTCVMRSENKARNVTTQMKLLKHCIPWC